MPGFTETLHKSIVGTLVVMAITLLRFVAGLGTQLVLARILLPEYFGIVAASWAIVGFLSNFTNFQASKYLIATRHRVQDVLYTTFWAETAVTCIVFVITWVATPAILQFAGKPHYIGLVQLLSFTFFSYPFQQLRAVLERDLNFRQANWPEVASIVANSVVSIGLAYAGYGVWSLVWGKLAQFSVQTAVIWLSAPYHPKWAWQPDIFREAFWFGWPLFGSAVLVFFYWNADYYLISYLLDEQQLGYYWLAFQMTHYTLQLKEGINKVAYPTFRQLGSDEKMAQGFVILSRYTALIFLLPCVVVWLWGQETVLWLFGGEQWLPATRPLQILMVVVFFRATFNYWDPVFMVKGKTHLMLWATVINAVILPLLGYLLTTFYGISGTATAVLATILCTTPFLAYHLVWQIRVSYWQVLYPPIGVALSSWVVGYWIRPYLIVHSLPTYLLTIGAITIIYALFTLFWLRQLPKDARFLLTVLRSKDPTYAA